RLYCAQCRSTSFGTRCCFRNLRGLSAMDQSIGLKTLDRQRAIASLSQFVAASVDAAPVGEAPFHPPVFDRVFPDDVYAAMLTAMPVASDYRPMSGRAKGNDLVDGTHTRVKIDLFPEYIRSLTAEKRAVWDIVGCALRSSELKEALVRRLAPGLGRRFGPGFGEVAMYPVPILTRDIPGYRLLPHPDTPRTTRPSPLSGMPSPCCSIFRGMLRRPTLARSFTSGCPTAACPSIRR